MVNLFILGPFRFLSYTLRTMCPPTLIINLENALQAWLQKILREALSQLRLPFLDN